MISTNKELLFAVEIAKKAGVIAMEHLRQGVSTSCKADGTPVTKADQECERLIRAGITEIFPDDGILGEEEAEKQAKAGQRRWILDPIDGTYNYARNIPIFATLLALEYEGEIVLGVVHAPAMLETFWAAKGQGAFKNGLRLQVSNRTELNQSLFNFGGVNRIVNSDLWTGFTKLLRKSERQRSPGDYLGFAQVFEGKADAMLEVGVKPWDIAPMKILIEESGGQYSDLSGGKSIDTGSCLISNGLVHAQCESILLGQSA